MPEVPLQRAGAREVGALAFERTGDPNVGAYNDAAILSSFGIIPEYRDELCFEWFF